MKTIHRETRLQGILTRILFTAALSFSIFQVADKAAAGSFPITLQVRAVVPARASMNIMTKPEKLIITVDDVRRGFVQVEEPMILALKNNSRAGCLLLFESQDLPYREARVSAMGKEVILGPNGGFVSLPVTGNSTVSMRFRFVLAKTTKAGQYAWPFSLSISPL